MFIDSFAKAVPMPRVQQEIQQTFAFDALISFSGQFDRQRGKIYFWRRADSFLGFIFLFRWMSLIYLIVFIGAGAMNLHMDYENNQTDPQALASIEIPSATLSPDALQGVIGEFILRDGTDYGLIEVSHATKVMQIERQLSKGEVKIIFDPNSETVTMMTAKEWEKILKIQSKYQSSDSTL